MSKWISVKDELPPLGKYVLTYNKMDNWFDSRDQAGVHFKVQLRSPYHESYEWEEFGPGTLFAEQVTHWMPLPELPDE